jgi:aldose 1-epimerase
MRLLPLPLVLCLLVVSSRVAAAVSSSPFGQTPSGEAVTAFTLTNEKGASVTVLTLGAIIAELKMPDRAGKMASVVREIKPADVASARGPANAAAVFGRVANRIANAKFTLDGKEYQVTKNNGAHQLHGGIKNLSKVIWTGVTRTSPSPAVELSYVSPDGDEGFPGKVNYTVTYSLTPENTLRLEYRATSDKPTPINLTNHAYFNLAGRGDVADTELTIAADRYTVVDADLIPTGEIKPVAGSPLDFTKPTAIGARAAQLEPKRRYDHNFVINRRDDDASLILCARARDPRSGRTMEVWTTQPGVQLYTSVFAAQPAKDNFGFFCLETQHFPDAVNHPNFPSTILRPGQTFSSTTEFRFSAK